MTFADLVQGDDVFIDANTFIYHFSKQTVFGSACSALFNRIERGELNGWTATPMITEVAHRLMLLEGCTLHGWLYGGTLKRLQRQPALITQLSHFRICIDGIRQSRIQGLAATPQQAASAAAISQQHGLLSTDALVLAIMQSNGITKLASNDSHFDNVPGITRYSPV